MNHYTAHYGASVAQRYAIRGWAAFAGWVALAIFLAWGLTTYGGNTGLAWTSAIIMLLVSLISLTAALTAKSKWGADGGLAIAITDEGVTLPGAGLIPWESITAVRSSDFGAPTFNLAIRAFHAWHGTGQNSHLAVFTGLTLQEVAALPTEKRHFTVAGPDGTWGFGGARIQGLGRGVWDQASAVLLHQAAVRGIAVLK